LVSVLRRCLRLAIYIAPVDATVQDGAHSEA
jgi:hypothetical protein